MSKFIFDSADPASARKAVHGTFSEARNLVMGIMDKVPEDFRERFSALKEKIDAKLNEFSGQPTTQVPAANEAAYALNCAASALAQMHEMFNGAMERLNEMAEELKPARAQLNSYEAAKKAGELVEKSEAEKRVQTAVEEAVKKEREHTQLLGQRRSILCSAELPAPVDEKILEGDEKTFETLKVTSAARLKELKEGGVHTHLNSAELAQLIYGPEPQFKLAVKMAQAPAKSAPAPEPMAGGGKPDGSKPAKLRL